MFLGALSRTSLCNYFRAVEKHVPVSLCYGVLSVCRPSQSVSLKLHWLKVSRAYVMANCPSCVRALTFSFKQLLLLNHLANLVETS